jgi:crossover junction endodeoxyribonuclease RusA
MSDSITIVIPVPVSANVYWRTRVAGNRAITYVSSEAKAFKEEIAMRLRIAGVVKPIEGRVMVRLDLYPHRPLDWEKRVKKMGEGWDDTVRCIDLDNAVKVTLDAMKGIAFLDDVWVRQIIAQRMEPDGRARAVVTISQWEKPK